MPAATTVNLACAPDVTTSAAGCVEIVGAVPAGGGAGGVPPPVPVTASVTELEMAEPVALETTTRYAPASPGLAEVMASAALAPKETSRNMPATESSWHLDWHFYLVP